MRIAVANQNRRDVTGHAGRCRNFRVYDIKDGEVVGCDLLELPKTQSFHDHDVRLPHPLDGVQVLITGGMGAGFVRKMAARGIHAVATSERDPDRAVAAWLNSLLERIAVEDHGHEHPRGHSHRG